MIILRRLFSLILIFTFSTPVYSNDLFRVSEDKMRFSLKGAEYISGDDFRKPVMKVNLIGAVDKPGVHIVPKDTTMTSLLAYAGGPSKEAEIDEIVIKRKNGKRFDIINYDLEEYVNDEKMVDVQLRPYDVIHVPQKDHVISDNTFRNLIILSTVLAVVVSAITIDDRFDGSNSPMGLRF